ncbi:MAG: tetratricopeptide repeat protein [Ekhidna sp.]
MQSLRILILIIPMFVTLHSKASGRDWIKSGQTAITSQNIEHAIFCYTQAIQNNSKNVAAYLLRAKAYRLNGDFIKAAEDKRAAFEIDASSAKQFLNNNRSLPIREIRAIEKPQ